LYNSDSEDDSDDSGDEQKRPTKGLPKGKPGQQSKGQGQGQEREKKREKGQAYIRGDGDEPMDLLSRSIAGGISRMSSFLPHPRPQIPKPPADTL
jgi:ribosomal RNA-processing protein 12